MGISWGFLMVGTTYGSNNWTDVVYIYFNVIIYLAFYVFFNLTLQHYDT